MNESPKHFEASLREDPEGFLKLLQLIQAGTQAFDTGKNAPFAGRIGGDKLRATDWKDTQSIIDHGIEGTDVAENMGMTPGEFKTWAVGQGIDLVGLPSMAIAKIAKQIPIKAIRGALSPAATLSEIVGSKLVDKGIESVVKKSVRPEQLKNYKVIAQEIRKQGLQKYFKNPEKGIDAVGGKSVNLNTGTRAFPKNEMVKVEEGLLDKTGQKITASLKAGEGRTVNRNQDIFKRMVEKVKSDNRSDIVAGKTNVERYQETLADLLSPTKKQKVDLPPPFVEKPKLLDDIDAGPIDEEISLFDNIVSDMKKAQKDSFEQKAKRVSADLVEEPPALDPDMSGLEGAIATLQNRKNSRGVITNSQTKIEMENAKRLSAYDKQVAAAKSAPLSKTEDVDNVSDLENLWQLKKSLHDKLNDSTWLQVAAGNNTSDPKKMILDSLKEIDAQIVSKLDEVGIEGGTAAQAYLSANNDYKNQSRILEIFKRRQAAEAQSSGTGLAGNMVRGAVDVAASGGRRAPLAAGRGASDAVGAARGGRVQIGLGESMMDYKQAIPATNVVEELLRWPSDPNEIEETPADTGGGQTPPTVNPSSLGDEWEVVEEEEVGRSSASVEELPDTRPVTDIMAPPADIEEKMDRRLQPELNRPLFDPYINEQILNTPLPRNTQRILDNPRAVKAKLGQLAPQYLPILEDQLSQDPETFKEAGPKLAMMFPDAFEKDKYGLFDGKLSPDPMMKQKFFQDLEDDEGMDSIQKVGMAMRAHRGLSIYGDE